MKTIAVIDFGGQYTHLIATRIRALGVRADLHHPEGFDPRKVPEVAGVVLSGGPDSVNAAGSPRLSFDPRQSPVPILGLCYGHQLLAKTLGGSVARGHRREYGPASIRIREGARLFAGLPPDQRVWMSHGDHVEILPAGFRLSASSDELEVAAFESEDARVFGFQFHPEVVHTEHGSAMLDRFLDLCVAERTWRAAGYRQQIIDEVRQQAGDRKVFLLLSGGVDSLVCLKVCLEALGPDAVVPVHIDTGFMRQGESMQIIDHLAREGFRGIHLVHAGDRFLEELSGVAEPEAKRRIIGRLFVEIVDEQCKALGLDKKTLLVQGTIYPDRIESGGGDSGRKAGAARIKTHHNRVDEIARMISEGRVLEPLRDLYKDEVRLLGRELGLPAALVDRHPFPGPGLAIRLLCHDGREQAFDPAGDAGTLADLLAPFGLEGRILPVRSVGVQGDERTYLHPAAVWLKPGVAFDWETLLEAARLVVNTLRTINRVVWTPRPVGFPKLSPGTAACGRMPARGPAGEESPKHSPLAPEGEGSTVAACGRNTRLRAHAGEGSPTPSAESQTPRSLSPGLSPDRTPDEGAVGAGLVQAFLTPDRLARLQAVDAVAREVTSGLADIWQMPVIGLPLVDAGGDEWFLVRPVTSKDAMTAEVFRMPAPDRRKLYAALEALPGVAGLFYDLTSKPPGTIEWE